MAAKAKLIRACRPQVVAPHPAVRIVAVGAAHFALTQRVMIRQAHFPALGLMALQAGIISLPLRLNKRLGFRDEIFYSRNVARTHQIETHVRRGVLLISIIVSLMTVYAANLVRGMRPGHPVADSFVASMATQASAVSVCRGTLTESDDFADISSAIYVQAAGTVTLLAFHALLRMKRMAEVLGYVFVTGGANLGSNRFRAGNLYEPGKRRNFVFGFLRRMGG
jgi:hypothetical protein